MCTLCGLAAEEGTGRLSAADDLSERINMNTTTRTERFYISQGYQQWTAKAEEISDLVIAAVNAFFDDEEAMSGWGTEFSTKYCWGPKDNSYVVTFHHHHIDGLVNYLEFKGDDNPQILVSDTSIKVYGGRMNALPTAF